MSKKVPLESYLTHEIPILRKLAKRLLDSKFIVEVTYDTFGGVSFYNEFTYFNIRKKQWKKKSLSFGYRHFRAFYFWENDHKYQHEFFREDLELVIDNNQFEEFLENIYKLQRGCKIKEAF